MTKKAPTLAVRNKDGSVRTFSKTTAQQVRASLTATYGRPGIAELSMTEIEPDRVLKPMTPAFKRAAG